MIAVNRDVRLCDFRDDDFELIAVGQRDFGESRVQEALEKWPALLARHPDVRLHCIGRLQSNKAARAAEKSSQRERPKKS